MLSMNTATHKRLIAAGGIPVAPFRVRRYGIHELAIVLGGMPPD